MIPQIIILIAGSLLGFLIIGEELGLFIGFMFGILGNILWIIRDK